MRREVASASSHLCPSETTYPPPPPRSLPSFCPRRPPLCPFPSSARDHTPAHSQANTARRPRHPFAHTATRCPHRHRFAHATSACACAPAPQERSLVDRLDADFSDVQSLLLGGAAGKAAAKPSGAGKAGGAGGEGAASYSDYHTLLAAMGGEVKAQPSDRLRGLDA